jgi:phospholipase C
VLKTVEERWNLLPLTARDAAAPGFGDVITLSTPRIDDVLAGVTVPVAGSAGPSAGQVSHLEAIRQELTARYTPGVRDAGVAPHYTPLAPLGASTVVQDPDASPAS